MVLADGLLLHVDDLLLVQLLLFWRHSISSLAWRLTWLSLHHERVWSSWWEALHTHSHHLRIEGRD